MTNNILIKSSGKSMFPLISSGDMLNVNLDYPFNMIKSGDIILFRNYSGKFLSHRVVEIIEKGRYRRLRAKGDFNHSNDKDLVNKTDYIGLVTAIKNEAYLINYEKIYSRAFLYFFQLYSNLMKKSSINSYIFNLVHNYFFYEFCILRLMGNKIEQESSVDVSEFMLEIIDQDSLNCLFDFKNIKVSEKKLFSFADNNKSISYLEHVLNCSRCKDNFSEKFKNKLKNHFKKNIYTDFQKKKIEHDLFLVAKKLKVNIVGLKKYFGDVKLKKHSTYDIDVLISKSHLKFYLISLFEMGYRILDYPPQEIHLVHLKHRIIVDLHYFFSIPRNLIFPKQATQKLTKDILVHSKNGLIEIEYYILSSVVRLWSNDFFHGLRKIFELSKILSNDHNIDWQKLKKISSTYGFWNEIQLLMLVGYNVFNTQLNKEYLTIFSVSWKVKLLSKHFDLSRISTFQGHKNWWDENAYFTRKYLVELLVVRQALNLKIYNAVLKPRVFLLFLSCIKRLVFVKQFN